MVETYAFPTYNQPHTLQKYINDYSIISTATPNISAIRHNLSTISSFSHPIFANHSRTRPRPMPKRTQQKKSPKNSRDPSNPNRHHIRHLLSNLLTNLYTCCCGWRWCVANMQRIDARDNAEVINHISVR